MVSDKTQKERDAEFKKICKVLGNFYSRKNTKYGDSFYRAHKTYKEAHYNLKRKFDRLQHFVSKNRSSAYQDVEIMEELVDMAIYSIMCLMKFRPKAFKNPEVLWDYLKTR